jgi:hypothetical protein
MKIEGRDNHLWDTEVMQVCMAIQFGVIRLEENFSVDLDSARVAA